MRRVSKGFRDKFEGEYMAARQELGKLCFQWANRTGFTQILGKFGTVKTCLS